MGLQEKKLKPLFGFSFGKKLIGDINGNGKSASDNNARFINEES